MLAENILVCSYFESGCRQIQNALQTEMLVAWNTRLVLFHVFFEKYNYAQILQVRDL